MQELKHANNSIIYCEPIFYGERNDINRKKEVRSRGTIFSISVRRIYLSEDRTE